MTHSQKNISTDTVIVGAGLTGLSAAATLRKAGHRFVLLEAQTRVGGQIRTVSEEGFTYECGPNTAAVSTPETAELFEDIPGISIEYADPAAKRRFIVKGGRLHALPSSLFSGICTPLFSIGDKLRLLGEPWRPPGNPYESIGEMGERRLGKSFVDYAIDPFIGGIYASDPYRLVTQYALPKLQALEQEYGSFIRGAVAKIKQPKTTREKKADKRVFSCPGGLESMVHGLADYIGREQIHLGVHINSIMPINDGGFIVAYDTDKEEEKYLRCHNIISTVGAHALANLFPFLGYNLLEPISRMRYAPVVEVAAGYRRRPTSLPPAFGCLSPSRENRRSLGILFPSDCFRGRAPRGGLLCTLFIGGMRNPEFFDLTDSELYDLTVEELRILPDMPEGTHPDLMRITRHKYAIPQYETDTPERLKAVTEAEKRFPGLLIGGGLRDGIGMPNRITQGTQLAGRILT